MQMFGRQVCRSHTHDKLLYCHFLPQYFCFYRPHVVNPFFIYMTCNMQLCKKRQDETFNNNAEFENELHYFSNV